MSLIMVEKKTREHKLLCSSVTVQEAKVVPFTPTFSPPGSQKTTLALQISKYKE